MSTRKRRKTKRAAVFCGAFAAIYFIGFFIVQIFEVGGVFSTPEWMNEDWHYIAACFAIVCFLLYTSIVVRIYTRRSALNPKLNGYMVYGVVLGILFILWSVSLLMDVLNIG